ncbi:hypothetical protein [Nocardia paucivorans]|uniref:hypothetical protein n=1 Tax=Nocardia paucivorans TaxID=114259 RepID=UPI0012FCB9FD|nr:hypothetical protein [Nocardia paucivorans]
MVERDEYAGDEFDLRGKPCHQVGELLVIVIEYVFDPVVAVDPFDGQGIELDLRNFGFRALWQSGCTSVEGRHRCRIRTRHQIDPSDAHKSRHAPKRSGVAPGGSAS